MKRPAGAIPPLTKEGLQTLVGMTVRVPYSTRLWDQRNSWLVKLKSLVHCTETDAVFQIVPRRYFKHRPHVALSTMRFEEEDPLVQSIRRERFLAKLSASAESRKAGKIPS